MKWFILFLVVAVSAVVYFGYLNKNGKPAIDFQSQKITLFDAGIEKKIIGKWEQKEKNGHLEFFSDGTYSAFNQEEINLSGRWTKIEKNRVKVDVTVLGTTLLFILDDIEFENNTMTYTMDGKRHSLSLIK